MEHWQLAYLGMRQIPDELNEFELATFFTFSRKERGLIDARRTDLYRLGVGLHIGFVRMTRTHARRIQTDSKGPVESPWRTTGCRSARARYATFLVRWAHRPHLLTIRCWPTRYLASG